MMVKKSVCITVESEIWDEAGIKLASRSEFCENQLRLFLDLNNDAEDKLLQQIQEKRDEINVLEDKLCTYRKERLTKAQDSFILDGPMESLNRIHSKLGEVGKNQIKKFAKKNSIPYDLLLEHCKESELNIVNFAEAPKA